MDFRKKLKTRLYVAISYMVLGVAMILIFNLVNTGNQYFSTLGFAFLVIGIARLRQYLIINKSEESVKKREIAESDERNIFIINKAKSLAFSIFVFAACVGVIVLQILNIKEYSFILSWVVCSLLLIYWICYWIIRKKS